MSIHKTLKSFRVLSVLLLFAVFICHGSVARASGDSAQQATNAQSQDRAAQIASILMAAALATQCGPQNPMACVMAALAGMQAGAAGGAAEGAGVNAGHYGVKPGGDGGGRGDGTKPVTNEIVAAGSRGEDAVLNKIKNDLASKGAVISEDGKSLSIAGKSYPLDGSGLSDGGASLGLSPQQVAAGQAALADAQAKVGGMSKSEDPVVAGGGGGPATVAAPLTPEPKMVLGRKPAAANLAGMSKNLGKDKIGVAADDIFQMITRRYKAKDATDTFIQK